MKLMNHIKTILLWDLIKGMFVTEKYQWLTHVTEEYPRERTEMPERFRGRLHVIREKCISCMLCRRNCPTQVITVTKNPEKKIKQPLDFEIDFKRCIYCGICTEVCPTSAIVHSGEFEFAVYDKEELVHKLESLGENLNVTEYKK